MASVPTGYDSDRSTQSDRGGPSSFADSDWQSSRDREITEWVGNTLSKSPYPGESLSSNLLDRATGSSQVHAVNLWDIPVSFEAKESGETNTGPSQRCCLAEQGATLRIGSPADRPYFD
jgi:hypothetical protein